MSNQNATNITSVNYNDENNWMFISPKINKSADLIYFSHLGLPSVEEPGHMWDIADPAWRRGMETAFAVQCGIFTKSCNVYSPYYRQYSGVNLVNRTTEEISALYSGIPYKDAEAAFDVYIKKYNNGRPFFLFGQSHGAGVLRHLILNYLKNNPDVSERLIAAYLIGFAITKDEIEAHPVLKAAGCADDTGVVVSYNTETPDSSEPNSSVMAGSLVINPLNWRTDDTHADASENLGAVITGRGKINIIPGMFDAQIRPERHTIACSTANLEEYGAPIRSLGDYHTADVAFYYTNLQKNVETRLNAYLNK